MTEPSVRNFQVDADVVEAVNRRRIVKVAGVRYEPTTYQPDDAGGVWLAYETDLTDCAIFEAEIDALRYAVERSIKVAFWRYGEDVSVVLEAAEAAAS